MNSLKIRLALVALAVLALATVNHGCSGDTNPAGPTGSAGSATFGPLSAAATDCGTSDFFTDLTPVLVSWEDSIEAWLGDGLLDSLAAYTPGKSPQAHLEELVPGLQQWEGAINLTLDSLVVDSVAAFDPATISVPGYLVGLSDLLAGWKTSLETYRGMEFLATPPGFDPDTTKPVIMCPADTTVDCADSSGVEVMFAAEATDDCDPMPEITYVPEPGTKFPLGETMVTCTATDSSGNSAECTFTVTVVHAPPPVITCPADTTAECTGPDGTAVEWEVTATSECDLDVTIACDPPSGSAFPIGTTTVTCIATDAYGGADTCSFDVTIEDTTPPTVLDAFATPDRLWPPNHKMVDVEVSVEATDVCDESVHSYIVDVSSNEEINGKGDGHTRPDWVIKDDLTVRLRAERSGRGEGRIYYLHLLCEDDSGNTAEHTVEVVVPHNQKMKMQQ